MFDAAARMRPSPLIEERWGFDSGESFDRGFGSSFAASWRGAPDKGVSAATAVSTSAFGAAALPTSHFTPAQAESPAFLLCGCPSCMKAYKGQDAFVPDGVGVDRALTLPTTPILLT